MAKSCFNCLRLETCRLRDLIKNPNIKTCNYAKEGCIHYRGEVEGKNDKERVLNLLKKNGMCSMSFVMQKIEQEEKQVIYNAVNNLIKRGVNIKKSFSGGEMVFELK